MRLRGRDAKRRVAADQRGIAGKIDHPIVFGPGRQLVGVARRAAGYERTFDPADHAPAVGEVAILDRALQPGESRLGRGLRDRIAEVRGRRSGTRAIEETEAAVEVDFLD